MATPKPKAKPAPMFDARAVVDQAKEEYPPLPFIGMDGKEYELPNPILIPSDRLDHFDELNERLFAHEPGADDEIDTTASELWAEVLDALGLMFEPDVAKAIRAMPSFAIGRLMEAWKGSVTEEGKSSRPRSAPNRAARRSKQTSPSKASTSGNSQPTKSRPAPKAS